MLNISVEVDGEEKLNLAFVEIENIISDFRPIWRDVQSEFHQIEREQFQSEGAAGASGKWKELSPKYKEVKQRKYGNIPILQASGALYKSLTGKTGDSIEDFQPMEATFGTSLKRGKIHQQKGRPPIDLSESQKDRIGEVIKKGVVEEVKKSGLETE